MKKLTTKFNSECCTKYLELLYYIGTALLITPPFQFNGNRNTSVSVLAKIIRALFTAIIIVATCLNLYLNRIGNFSSSLITFSLLKEVIYFLLPSINTLLILNSVRHETIWYDYLKSLQKIDCLLKLNSTKNYLFYLELFVVYAYLFWYIYFCVYTVSATDKNGLEILIKFCNVFCVSTIIVYTHLMVKFSKILETRFNIFNSQLLKTTNQVQQTNFAISIYVDLSKITDLHNGLFGLPSLLTITYMLLFVLNDAHLRFLTLNIKPEDKVANDLEVGLWIVSCRLFCLYKVNADIF